MTKLITAALLLLFSFAAKAQITEKIRIKAGENISEALSTHGLYKFPAFDLGTVLFKDGSTTNAKMNFNVFMNAIQFIGNNGDTMVIDKPELIDTIKIDSSVFIYKKEYMEVIADYNGSKLLRQQKISSENIKNGAFGLPSPGASIESYGRSTSTTSINQLTLNEDIVVERQTSYSLSYKKFCSAHANQSGFFDAFPGIKKEILDFINQNKTDFKKEDDLKKLLQFCAQHS